MQDDRHCGTDQHWPGFYTIIMAEPRHDKCQRKQIETSSSKGNQYVHNTCKDRELELVSIPCERIARQ
ncbi:hypothetical protein [Photobacterium sp. Hal280]|uniref:hypothetical protein n=1 Tax=Photobacterium sp. Hal280 TaxID=3035163 RepID=UPI00301CA446